ncbi:transglutaminase domain-containing protein [Chamaesiphon sp. VAR_69_metabat_338]|uniref:transglutaminase domain-containing protein n=1 Tax=Chamaesiphon sp. VAR_69_metabat_338 TaxID=2964704 RepID=UPI00286E59DC|nr:transglutaminase domain-containing protein [Chamaesiphon sp. VAR_69_metabat_338]
MNTSISSLCSLAICFWGFQTGLWVFAAIALVALEGRRFVRWQWDLSLNQLKELCKLWGILVIGSSVFLLIAHRAMFIYSLLQWLPFLCLPLVIGQTYVDRFSTLLPLLLTDPTRTRPNAFKQPTLNIYYLYFAICLIAASASNRYNLVFYCATLVLVAWLLWTLRPRHAGPAIWVCLLVMAGAIGFGSQLQLHQLQAKLEEQVAPLLSGLTGESIDPYQAQTRVGSIGDLKQSNEIIFRVAGDLQQFPLLMREASYNKYASASWVALKSKFTAVLPRSDGSTWQLGESQTSSNSITISSQLNRGKAILRLPHGTTAIDSPKERLRQRLNVEEMMQNQYGTVKVRGQGSSLTYQAYFNREKSIDPPPTDADLQIPASEQPAIAQTLQHLNVQELAADRVLDRLSNFFTQNFRYSLKLAGSGNYSTPLSAFLLEQRAGHCEYFATATTLLLRGAGIPARYVVGYSVREWSPLEQQFVVRSRHAHAWVMAYTNGNWQSFDTTPPDWAAQEDATASPFQTISDLWSFLSFQASRGLAHIVAEKTTILVWAIPVGGVFLLWRFRRRWRFQRASHMAMIPERSIPIVRSGLDSEFYEIDRALQNLGLHRLSGESFQQWLLRIEPHLPESQYSTLKQILDLHHCYRFDPQGLGTMERQQLQELSRSCLDYFASYRNTKTG